MSDQPKPNQPPSTSPPVEASKPPKETSPEADKVSVQPGTAAESKPSVVEPKPSEANQSAADVKPDSKPETVAATENSASAKPVSSDRPAASPSDPTKPASPAQATDNGTPAKPASTDSAAAKPVEPAKPASAATEADRSPSSKPETDNAPVKAAGSESAPVQSEPTTRPPAPAPAAPTSSTTSDAKRDISEDPTLPGKPSAAPASPTNVPPVLEKDDTIAPLSGSSKVTQRFPDPSPAAQTSPGTICPSCGHRNRPGTLVCDNCGTNLVGGIKAAIGTRDLVSATEAAETSAPLLDDAQLNAVESAGGATFTDDMVLRIEIEGGATPMLVYPKQEIILGRRDPNTGTLPDVDMTAYSGYRMGVSRTHASIRLQDKQLNLSDRGSSNGTFLNGTRLVAHRPYPLRDGDEIRLGQMVLKIYFQSNKPRK